MDDRELALTTIAHHLDHLVSLAERAPATAELQPVYEQLVASAAQLEGLGWARLARRVEAVARALELSGAADSDATRAAASDARYAVGVVSADGTDEGLPETEAANTPPVDDEFIIIEERGTAPLSPEFAAQFAVEALEALTGCEGCLLTLEADPGDREALNAAFRHLHSFKGNCGFLGLARMEAVAHAAESVLAFVKDGELPLTHATASLLLQTIDAFNAAMHGGFENDQVPNAGPLLEQLEACQDQVRTPGAMAAVVEPVRGPTTPPTASPVTASALPASAAPPSVSSPAQPLPQPPPPAPVGFHAASQPQPPRSTAAATVSEPSAAPDRAKVENSTLRVDAARLDELLDLVGELIIGGMAVSRVVSEPTDPQQGANAVAQLDRVIRAMQDAVMSLRMVPVEASFRRMVRVVRDVALKQGKEIELVRDGEDTEIDKTVAEQLADPLVHLMRNAVDHGIEGPEERAKAGKPRVGHVHLSARHQGGEVWITVQDDGRGLDRARLLSRAVERGILTADRGERMTDAEVYNLIFEAGFSTASVVSDISGRGVGMDVVRRNVEAVKGRIDVSTVLGKGTAFTIRIPLTLAIVEGMLVRVGTSSFTIPLNAIRESVRPRAEDVTILSTGAELVRIRGQLLPVVRLAGHYGIPGDTTRLDAGILVVVEHDDRPLCLFVDELVGQRQTVVKSLSGFLGTIPGLTGCTVLGDGRISLILDVPAFMSHHGRTA